MKIIIELNVDMSDFSPEDADRFISEAQEANGIHVEVGRPIDEDKYPEGPYRIDALNTEYFTVRKEN
jgi:hypothetical protein